MYDMHCHLGFFEDAIGAAHEIVSAGHACLCATVEPQEFEALSAAGLQEYEGVRLGVGLHPWWVADGSCDDAAISRACELAQKNRYIAEVGLDFSGKRAEQGERQVAAFECILEACAAGGHVLSIHAVNSAGEVLNLLDQHQTLANNSVIFHWFSGSGYELMRARQAGCYFSVGPRMLETKRGRAYAQQIPTEQLLFETDLPSSDEEGQDLSIQEYLEQLSCAQETLLELKGEAALEIICATSKKLLEL